MSGVLRTGRPPRSGRPRPGTGWEQVLLDAYGIKPDAERTRYYRLLWDLG